MGLSMKNFNIGIHWKIQFLGVMFAENQCIGECLRRGVYKFADLRGAWQKRGSGVFEVGLDTPMHTMSSITVYCTQH